MVSLKMLPARNGDAFLIRHQSAAGSVLILIDGGFASTFRESILPELKTLGAAGEILTLVVVTHIDEDHILGVHALIDANGPAHAPAIIPIENVWHNSLRSMQPPQQGAALSPTDQNVLAAIGALGYQTAPDAAPDPEEISARQGSTLAALLRAGAYVWNGGDGRRSINSSQPGPYEPAPGVKLHILGPSVERLEQLRKHWTRELRKLGVLGAMSSGDDFEDAFELVCAHDASVNPAQPEEIARTNLMAKTLAQVYEPDDSPTNGSSISFILETVSARLLFLGDAWSEDMESQLAALTADGSCVQFDAIKVSHHGSLRNTSPRLLELIDAPRYFISTNGTKHSHPDFPVLKGIVDRPTKYERHLHFNYATPASRELKKYTSKSGAPFVVHENSTQWIDIKGCANAG